ncbi:riboflavin kinase / FAD synthase family protein, putative [Plasmodium knowlesi strain H]|uniref:riboflavin kinase n=3 Tax=Plasmodium knowlesi TaxID=5850 RepID=A0A5K1VIX7_PLAKH|nr:riboflavin kinase, putative [Plasmodium knowlesi strain H]OTN64504.1 putative Riboflavin kinase / FAD synthase family protein [Plasmodium knowlesi]CAA9988951.1 riboflavin kinase, putative [Plasmodium knowlesi strain H]SBO24795.1 riboflavin kinase / FAD synthase family protein, putative [Plasmodium knowlesi strain H]SBO28058.1 riboflavin kinase / FAD synthase family protein, putative [Plasmodium knowlesi strain H]VVS78425.1 riboflavin kinase, putative [Plasmodium knowlesi strain H]|eukprot:XP_002261299.1 riboflavin kinase / FAD synthase family protein,putative [Plasmodium knowlesi strain H]
MRANEGKKPIALIDADHYIINYRSTITTYVQNICNNLLKENGDSADHSNKEWDAKRRERIVCVFMFSMYLNNIHRNLNMFGYLHDVLIKYNHLMGRSRVSQGGIEKGEDRKMDKLHHVQVNETTLDGRTSLQREMGTCDEQYMGEKDGGSSGEGPSRHANNAQPGDICHFMHDLIKDKNYANMDNVRESKVCFLNIKNKEKNAKGSPESLIDSFDAEGHTCATELSSNSKISGTNLGHATKRSSTSNSDEDTADDEEGDVIADDIEDIAGNTAEESFKSAVHPDGDDTSLRTNRSTPAEAVNEDSLEDPQDDSFHESQGSTYRFSNSSPVCQGQKQFLINYSSVHMKVKNFDSLLCVENFLVEQKKQANIQHFSKEIENLYRIIVLSKLHIGVYRFLTFLKKEKYFLLFFSSNKKLTQTLFRYFKISKYFKNCYKIIDSFEELEKIGNANKEVLIFSNRECFVNSAKREGYFNVAGGKKNPSMATNCDDVNWDMLKYSQVFFSDTSDYMSNKYNDVVYPFVRNCNLTEDILSWRIFYIFKKYMYIHGTVVKGFGRGSKYLNIPTANISYSNLTSTDIMPGIYFGISRLKRKIYKTVVSIGYNPFFENKHITIEAFLYYKTNTLFYDEDIHLIIVGILRSESNFSYFSHLIQAIQFDCELARIILSRLQDDEQFLRCRDYLQSL